MIANFLAVNAARTPEATALVFGASRQSYAALNERVCRAARGLTALGVARGDRVAALVNNCNQFIEMFFATAKLGAVFVPVNFRLVAREVAEILRHCSPSVLFVGESLAPTVVALKELEVLPRHLIMVPDRPLEAGSRQAEDGYEAWLARQAAEETELGVTLDEVALLMHSSGTTGRPKSAVWTHGTTLASSLAKIIDFGLTGRDATVVFGPLFHAGPLLDLAVPVLLCGGKLVVGQSTGFDPRQLLRTVADERATVVTVYPTMWRRVMALDNFAEYDLANLRLLFTGGEVMPVPLLESLYRRFPGAGFVNTYGSTEGGPITTFLAPEESRRKVGSVGRPAFSVAVRIADGEGRALAAGEVGELLVRSPFVCRGYWDRPEETAAALREGWWHTGDLARCDDEGFIWIVGRKKDMIISGGENIYPIEIEQVIAKLDGVVDVAVVGVPDADWGEAVAAYVVKAPGAALTAADVIERCRRDLASYKKPRHVRFIENLPRTTVNKISKDSLRAQFAAAKGRSS